MTKHSTSSYRDERDLLLRELDALGSARGWGSQDVTCRVFTEIIRWLRNEGHGSVELNAIGGSLSGDLKIRTIRKVGEPKRIQ